MSKKILTRIIPLFASVLLLLSSGLSAFAAPTPSNFWGNLYVNDVMWADGGQNHHITMDVEKTPTP
jgi:hypothetical protein